MKNKKNTEAPNHMVPKPKFVLSLTEAVLTGYLLKFLGYLIIGVISWKLLIGFFLYQTGRKLHYTCGIP